MTVLNLLVISAITGVSVFVVLFVAGVRRKQQGWSVLVGTYVRHLFAGAAMVLALVVVIVFAVTASYDSPQGPLALIVLGPAAVFAGGLAGACRWLIRAPIA